MFALEGSLLRVAKREFPAKLCPLRFAIWSRNVKKILADRKSRPCRYTLSGSRTNNADIRRDFLSLINTEHQQHTVAPTDGGRTKRSSEDRLLTAIYALKQYYFAALLITKSENRMPGAAIDHIVLLLSTAEFENLPSWLTTNFNILSGGKHVGQSSRNKLIVFKDGTYIELFNWFDTPPPSDHEHQPMRSWALKKPGLIDCALTSLAPSTAASYVSEVNQLLLETLDHGETGDCALGVKYDNPVPGGRYRADGVEIAWEIARPVFERAKNTPDDTFFPGGRLDAPFFCHDITDREMRVPFKDASKTTHPCGALGIASVEYLVPDNEIYSYAQLYATILRSTTTSKKNVSGSVALLIYGQPVAGVGGAKVVVRSPKDERELAQMMRRGIGISGLVLYRGQNGNGGSLEEATSFGLDDIALSIKICG